jgi:hypothetical protein
MNFAISAMVESKFYLSLTSYYKLALLNEHYRYKQFHIPNTLTISTLTRSVAVAVSPSIGTEGNLYFNIPSFK